MNTVNCVCYLVLKKKKYSTMSVRATMKKPSTQPNEVALRINLEVPAALFEKPLLEAKIEVPDGKAFKPVITADVKENLAEIIKEQTGLTVHFAVDAPEAKAEAFTSNLEA